MRRRHTKEEPGKEGRKGTQWFSVDGTRSTRSWAPTAQSSSPAPLRKSHRLRSLSPQRATPPFSALGFPVFCRYCVFYKLKVSGNRTSSRSTGTIFSTACAHFVSLSCFGESLNISNFSIIMFVTVICDQ